MQKQETDKSEGRQKTNKREPSTSTSTPGASPLVTSLRLPTQYFFCRMRQPNTSWHFLPPQAWPAPTFPPAESLSTCSRHSKPRPTLGERSIAPADPATQQVQHRQRVKCQEESAPRKSEVERERGELHTNAAKVQVFPSPRGRQQPRAQHARAKVLRAFNSAAESSEEGRLSTLVSFHPLIASPTKERGAVGVTPSLNAERSRLTEARD